MAETGSFTSCAQDLGSFRHSRFTAVSISFVV
jgi:hypothetical protein